MTKAMSAHTTPTTRRPRFESERHIPRKTQPSKARWIRGSAPLSAPHAPHAKYGTPGSRSVVPHRKQRRSPRPTTAPPPREAPAAAAAVVEVEGRRRAEGRRLLELDANERAARRRTTGAAAGSSPRPGRIERSSVAERGVVGRSEDFLTHLSYAVVHGPARIAEAEPRRGARAKSSERAKGVARRVDLQFLHLKGVLADELHHRPPAPEPAA